MATLNDFKYIDGVHDVLAIYVNNILATALRAEYKNVETLTADRELLDVDTPIQRLDCGAADRIVKVPAGSNNNHVFFIVNASAAARLITLKSNDAITTHTVISQGNVALAIPDGNGGYKVVVGGEADISGIFSLTGDISPAQITADQDNYNPTGLSAAAVLRLSTDAARNITGLAGGADGRILIIHNVGAQNIVLNDENASSTAANRFALNADVTIGADSVAILQYDSTSSRWRVVSGGGGGGAWGGISGTILSQTDLDYLTKPPADAGLINGKILPSIVTNNLKLEVKTSAGNDPSAAEPVYAYIDGVRRSITAALSVTINAGTSIFNAGSTELAAKKIQLFAYIGWRAASSTVFISCSRASFGTTYADFSITSTDEKYLAYSGSAPASTDVVHNIGRFNAQNSGTASFNWTIPAGPVIQGPFYETDWLSWQPTYSGSGSMTFTTVTTEQAVYKLAYDLCAVSENVVGTTGGTASFAIRSSAPFKINTTKMPGVPYLPCYIIDSTKPGGYLRYAQTSFEGIEAERIDEASWGLGSGRRFRGSLLYAI